MKLAQYQRLLFFYAHKDLFPVATIAAIPADTPEAADTLLRERGDSIVMELANTVRAGDNGKIWLLLPEYWLFGETLILRQLQARAQSDPVIRRQAKWIQEACHEPGRGNRCG